MSAPSSGSGTPRLLRMSYLAAGIGGIGFFVMSVLLLGVWPGQVLEREMTAMGPEAPLDLTASEARGRTIYAREGCAYCHTQQIRHTDSDVARFGAPVLAWETRFDYPQLWGTRRIGPDLAREGSVRSDDWQLAHLYSPRELVPESIMPAYPWLFDGAPDRPNQAGRDLLAYLLTLGRARELAGPEGEARARAACDCPGMEAMQFDYPQLNANPAKSRPGAAWPQLSITPDNFEQLLPRGRELFALHCAACHGATGEGNGGGARALHPAPANLAQHDYHVDRIAAALWNGSRNTAMPAWRELPAEDLAALAAALDELSPTQSGEDIAPDVRTLGARVYASRCAQCHGDRGGGDGSAVRELAVAPLSFRDGRPSLDLSLRAVREGVEGTKMAAWSAELSAEEIDAVARYLRTLYEEER